MRGQRESELGLKSKKTAPVAPPALPEEAKNGTPKHTLNGQQDMILASLLDALQAMREIGRAHV